jgi:A/G-specific adenine glycosylase
MELPSGAWVEDGEFAASPEEAPLAADWRRVNGMVRHTFTHFHLELELLCARLPADAVPDLPARCRWVPRRDLAGEALPSVMRKLVALAEDGR